MKKPKKIRKYEADGYIFNTFKELKNYVYFNTSTKMKKICYELEEDVITKKYIFTKQERGYRDWETKTIKIMVTCLEKYSE